MLKDTCTAVFIVVVFMRAKRWNPSRHLSTDKRTNKFWLTYATEYYLIMKTKQILSFAIILMSLEGDVLSGNELYTGR